MASEDEYQHYNFAQQLIDIDVAVQAIDAQLNVATKEVERLAQLSKQLKQHNSMYKNVWKQHNTDKLAEVLAKSKKLDDILCQNF